MNIIQEVLVKTEIKQKDLALKLNMSEQTLSNKKVKHSSKLKLTEEQYEILREIILSH